MEKKKQFKHSQDTMKIYMDWLHDKESINNDPREAVTQSNFTPSFQRIQQKDELDLKIGVTITPPTLPSPSIQLSINNAAWWAMSTFISYS